MIKGRPSLTYTPLTIKRFQHHGPPDPAAADSTLSLGFSPVVVTGRGGAAITTGRSRKKRYSKSVSQKKELRRVRRAKSGRKKDVLVGEGGDDFKENLGKNSGGTAAVADANISDWDEMISSPENEFSIDDGVNVGEDDESNASRELGEDADYCGDATDFHVDSENNDEGEEGTVVEESGNDGARSDSDDDSSLVQMRLFPSSTAKKRRVIREEEEDSTQDTSDLDMDTSTDKSKKARESNRRVKRRCEDYLDDDSSNYKAMDEIESMVAGGIGGGDEVRRRSKRVEPTIDGDFLDEDSENEFTVNSDSFSSKMTNLSTSSGKEVGQATASKGKKVELSVAGADTINSGVLLYHDGSSCSNKNYTKKGKIEHAEARADFGDKESHLDEDSLGALKKSKMVKKAKEDTSTQKSIHDDGSSNCDTKQPKNKKTAKASVTRSAPAKSSLTGVNPFVEAANAKYAATKAVKDAYTKHIPKKKTENNFFDFEEDNSSDDEVGMNDDASEYQPTQCDEKKIEVVERNPRPFRRSSSRIKDKKNGGFQPSANDDQKSTALVVVPRRRKKNGQKKKASGAKPVSTKSAIGIKDCLATGMISSKKSTSFESKSSKDDGITTTRSCSKKSKVNHDNTKQEKPLDLVDGVMSGEETMYHTDGLDVEYDEAEEEVADSVYNPSMLLTQAAVSQFLEQSMGSSTAEAEGGNRSRMDSHHHSKKLKSIHLSTRPISEVQVAASQSATSTRIKASHEKPVQLTTLPISKIHGATSLSAPSTRNKTLGTSYNGPCEEKHEYGKTVPNFKSSIEFTTRGISNMDSGLLAAIQTQPQTTSRSQHSSAISPETNASAVGEKSKNKNEEIRGNEVTSPLNQTNKSTSSNSGQKMNAKEMADALKTMAQHVAEVGKICEKVITQFH